MICIGTLSEYFRLCVGTLHDTVYVSFYFILGKKTRASDIVSSNDITKQSARPHLPKLN